MKSKTQISLAALLLALAPMGALAQVPYFTDTFTTSTTNGLSIRSGLSTASTTSYDIASTKNTTPNSPQPGTYIASGDFHMALQASTSSGFMEAQAIFATNGNPIELNQAGDYIDVMVVFTNTLGSLFQGSGAPIWLGLYNSGGVLPATNLFNSGLTTTANPVAATNGAAGWVGYISSINLDAGNSRISTRPSQVSGTDSADEDLVAGGFGGGGYAAVGSTTLATGPVTTYTLPETSASTIDLRITLVSPGTLMISNYLYSGVGTGGTVIYSNGVASVTGANLLATTFDGLCLGISAKANTLVPVMDVSSITITGMSSLPSQPTITVQPVPVACATGGSCEFSVTAVGTDLSYLWYRNNVSLSNVNEFSGATSPQLLISPVGSSDAGQYYCVITGIGGTTNTVTNSLSLLSAESLIWTAANGSTWDLATTANWEDATTFASEVFNEGDKVRFDDTATTRFITVSGSFLSPASITVDSESGNPYSFSGSGSIAGTGYMLYTGNGQLTLNQSGANTFSGGVLVSNSLASPDSGSSYVYLETYSGLGNGPLTLSDENANMEIVPTGGSATGIAGNINVLSDYNIQVDGNGTYASVFLGNLSGSIGKTLSLTPETAGTTNRIRVYGTNTVFNSNLALDTNAPDMTISQAIYFGTVLAPYEATGIQIYNGVISGYGGIAHRGAATAELNAQNTYSGGTFATAGALALGVDSTPTSGSTVTSGPIGTGPLFLAPEVGSATGTGTILATNGSRTIGNPIVYPSGTNNLTFVIGGTTNLTLNGAVTLNNDGNTLATYPSRIWDITSSGATTIAGVISDSSSFFALTKNGAGSLYLNGANTYSGVTTNASSGTASTPGLLSGTGSIAGSVVVLTNSAIGGGSASTIGTLTIGGNLMLTNGNGWFRVNRSSFQSDKVSVTGTITNFGAGTISITNLGATLQSGDTFHVFNKAVTGGGSMSVVGSGMTWINSLATNGTVIVQGVIVTTPPTLTNSINGSVLSLSWGSGYAGYVLQSETNALTTGLTTNSSSWFDVPNSANVLSTNITINPKNPAVFYRLAPPGS